MSDCHFERRLGYAALQSQRQRSNTQLACRAGLADLKSAIGPHTGDITAPGNTALDIADYASKRATMPKVVRDFIKRTTDPNQGSLTYEEARQFYSNASSRFSAEKAQRLAPQAKRLLRQFTSDLGDALKDTADKAGRLQDYLDAMSEYRGCGPAGAVG